MKITKTSMFTGKEHTMEIPVTEEQIKDWKNGKLIQDAMPNLTADQREFLMTGCTPEEWEENFSEELLPCQSKNSKGVYCNNYYYHE